MMCFVCILCFVMWVASFFTDVSVFGFGIGTSEYTRLTYMFCHRSTVHFIGNMFAVLVCYRTSLKLKMKYLEWLMVPVCILATFGSEVEVVTVGLSGAVYMYLGSFLCKIHTRDYLLSLALLIVTNVVLYVYAGNNVMVHLLAFVYGYLFNRFIALCQRKRLT